MSASRDQKRIQAVDPTHAADAIRQLFTGIRAKFALVPNLFCVLANAPAALEGLVDLSVALARGALDEKTREQLALAIAETNLCAYCLNAHAAVGGARAYRVVDFTATQPDFAGDGRMRIQAISAKVGLGDR